MLGIIQDKMNIFIIKLILVWLSRETLYTQNVYTCIQQTLDVLPTAVFPVTSSGISWIRREVYFFIFLFIRLKARMKLVTNLPLAGIF